MRKIIIETPKGTYSLPAILVAEDRTNYYAINVDGYKYGSKEWLEELEYSLNDDFEMIDWLINNTDWCDWEQYATKIDDKVNVTEDDFWCSSDNFKIKD